MPQRDATSTGAALPREPSMGPGVLDAAALASAGRSLRAPFVVRLLHACGSEEWYCTEVLRVLPGRRVVARASHAGIDRILKIYLGAGAGRYCARDRYGVQLLRDAGVSTPALVAEGTLGSGARVLVFEYLPNASSIGAIPAVSGCAPAAAALPAEPVAGLLRLLAQMHSAGLVHVDPHLDNFLVAGGGVHAIDGAAVRRALGGVVSRQRSIANVAALVAQFPIDSTPPLGAVWSAYAGAREWPVDETGVRLLAVRTRTARRRRARRYLRKTVRDCTEFRVERRFDRFVACLREEAAELQALLDDPDTHMRAGRLLKAGNTATLAAVPLGSRTVVVKRYNIKSRSHWLRRCWRPSRAWVAWRNGHRLRLLGIGTARPLAIIERRFGPLRRTAYLVMEMLPGPDLKRLIADETPLHDELVERIGRLFRNLFEAELVHGDTKASNFIVVAERHVDLIDLDAMSQPWFSETFHRQWRRDMRRFLANWPPDDPDKARLARLIEPRADPLGLGSGSHLGNSQQRDR
jgi:tRNA A-37 threonylcarbamoyl transferase component Bud32